MARFLGTALAVLLMGPVIVALAALVILGAAGPAATSGALVAATLGGSALAALLIAALAPSGRAAWARLCFCAALLCLALPLAAVAMSAAAAAPALNAPGGDRPAVQMGVALGAGMVTAFSGIVALFGAAIFFALAFALRTRRA